MGDSASTSKERTATARASLNQATEASSLGRRLALALLALVAFALAPLAFLAGGAAAEVPLLDEGAEDVHDRPRAELGGHVRDVVGRRDLDHLHAADPLAGHHPQRLECLAGQQAPGLGRSRPGHEAGVDRVDV